MAFDLLIGTPAYNASLASITPSYPAGYEVGDYLFAHIIRYYQAGSPITVPAGWSTGALTNTSEGYWWSGLYRKIVEAGDDATPTWIWTNASVVKAYIVAVKSGGFNPSGVVDKTSNTLYTTLNYTVRAAGVTVSAAKSNGLLFAWGASSADRSFSGPSGWTVEDNTYHQYAESLFAYKTEIAAGATGNIDSTFGDSATRKHAFMTILGPWPNTRRRLFNRAPV